MAIDFYKHRHIPKISSAIALIAFLMPFFLVKCGNTVIDDIKGYELLSGKNDIGANEDPESAMDMNPNVFAMIGFACAIGIVVLSWMRNNKIKLLQLIISALGFVSLILLFVNVAGTDVSGNQGTYATMISIELSYGYYSSQLGFLIGIIFHWLEYQDEKKNNRIPNERIVDDDSI